MNQAVIAYVRRHHLALLCLFLIVGGGAAYAADGPLAGQNTVGSEDIIGNEVKSDDIGNGRIFNLDIADEIITGQKLKNGTVTGDDIDESTLSAENWHEIDAAGEPPFLSTNTDPICFEDAGCAWRNYDGTHNSAGFYRDPFGEVHLKGLVCRKGIATEEACLGGSLGLDDIFVLPPGYRPPKVIELATSSEGAFARVEIKPDGTVSADPPYNYGSLYLDNLGFRCAPRGQDGCP